MNDRLASIKAALPHNDGISRDNAEWIVAEVERLRSRRDEHLRLIRTLSVESIPEGEADELRGQIAALIAEVGTLRAERAEMCAWRDELLTAAGVLPTLPQIDEEQLKHARDVLVNTIALVQCALTQMSNCTPEEDEEETGK